jgi:hypothetical protein
VFCWSIVSAEAFDGSKDVIGGLCPSERFGIGIVSVDERSDVSSEGGDAAIDAAPDLLIREEREEALDLVEAQIAISANAHDFAKADAFFERKYLSSSLEVSASPQDIE